MIYITLFQITKYKIKKIPLSFSKGFIVYDKYSVYTVLPKPTF